MSYIVVQKIKDNIYLYKVEYYWEKEKKQARQKLVYLAIPTNNEAYYNRVKLLRQLGMSPNDRVRHTSAKEINEDRFEVGYNYRYTDIQAAVGIKQPKCLDWTIAERRKIARQYHSFFF